ncbi:hypothetical protein OnM2_059078 [Erysiphe neolycopersici]|uniref:Uncharacterized protein n=1 Tax=Erysiphe neolycopersici TaxID=212602 RepID=A0A420HQ82_9PEZI|nr:hypothetical protein OnM2_059078 [Erysiphe neolycopersici]
MSIDNEEKSLNENASYFNSVAYQQYIKNTNVSSVENEKLDDLFGFRGSLESTHTRKSSRSSESDENLYSYFSDTTKLDPSLKSKNIQVENRCSNLKVLVDLISRFFITLALSGLYSGITLIWLKKNATGAFEKRLYNTIVTGISIALGLNLSSAFRDISLSIRWSIVALGEQNLEEMNLILQSESLTTIVKLATVSRRPVIIIGCIAWLLVNIIIQAGLALLSLTYNFDVDPNLVQLKPGKAAIPRMDHFYPQTNHVVNGESLRGEQYTAHTYGEFALNFGIGLVSSEPSPGKRYLPTDPLLWLDKSNSIINFVFLDSPKDSLVIDSFSAFTERKISVTYKCNSFRVLSGGNGTVSKITVDRVGNVLLPQAVPDSTTFLTRANHTCPGDNRCSIVEAFESSATDPWYYICEISLGKTQNDPQGVSFVSDYLAQIATASIAQIGYTDSRGYASQVYPRESLWSQVAKGNADSVGMVISLCALSSIAGAAQFNPFTSYITPNAPSPGFLLILNHRTAFFTILILINICHLLFVILVVVTSRWIKAGPNEFTGISLLMKPITDLLVKPYSNEKWKEYNDVVMNTFVRYEKDNNDGDRWKFSILSK